MARDAIRYRVGGTLIAIVALAAAVGWGVLQHIDDPVTHVRAELAGEACGPVQNADACTLVLRSDGGSRSEAQVRCVARAEGPDGVIDTREVFAGPIGGGDLVELPVDLPQITNAFSTFWTVSCLPS